MTDLTEDEQALEGLLTRYGQTLVEAHCPGRHMFWTPLTDDQTAKIGQRVAAILAHYRKAKAEVRVEPKPNLEGDLDIKWGQGAGDR